MVMAFFNSCWLIYTQIILKDSKINNVIYTVKVPGIFMKKLRQKQPEMSQEWFFHWDDAPVHNATIVQARIATNNIQVMEHPPYSPDLALVDYFLFRRAKEELAGIWLTPESLKKTWGWGHKNHQR
jgi:histone-lysine N-methyltransferase SETMAR